MPLLAAHVASESQYFARKEEICGDLLTRFSHDSELEVTIALNRLDRPGAAISGVYLSVLGTSAEDGDSGQVGRGNRVNGVISFNRPGGSEAAAGKNAISHVGKIYSVLSEKLATRIHSEITDLRQVTVWLCGRIGDRIDTPQVVSVEVSTDLTIGDLVNRIESIVRAELHDLNHLTKHLIDDSVNLW
jgi:S-adenosylmethionine synthetase